MFYVKRYTAQPVINESEWISDIEKYLVDPYSETSTNVPKYPLTNIGFIGNKLVFELDVAGYNTFKVTYVGNVVTVKGSVKSENTENNTENNTAETGKCCSCCTCTNKVIDYIQKNIPNDDFTRNFYLVNDYLGSTIKWNCKNGLLRIVATPHETTADTEVQPSDDVIETGTCNCECCGCNESTD